MIKKVSNNLSGTIITDVERSIFPNDKIFFSKNASMYNMDKNNFVLSPIKSNEYLDKLEDTDDLIGVIEHELLNVLFIKSNVGGVLNYKVATFPSPKSYNTVKETYYEGNVPKFRYRVEFTAETGFEEKIKLVPAIVYDDGVIGGFYGDFLSVNENNINGFLDTRRDGSIVLYWTDQEQELRTLNLCFDKNGNFIDNTLNKNTIPNSLRLIQGISEQVDFTFDSIIEPGELPFGNYFFYLKMMTSDTDETDIIKQVGPISLQKGASGGNTYTTGENSKKGIRMMIGGLKKYMLKYAVIYYTRYTQDEAGNIVIENKKINKFYPLSGDTLYIDIHGTESEVSVSYEQILTDNTVEDIAKGIINYGNRLLMFSTSRKNLYNDIFRKAALNIQPVIKEEEIVIPDNISESDYLDKRYYMPSETYPFALRFEFHNGNLSPAYPVKGYDAIKGTTNDRGYVRFPLLKKENFFSSYTTGYNVLAYSLDFPLDNLLTGLSQDEKDWLNENIKGITIVRGKRFKNLYYTGLGINVIGRRFLENFSAFTPDEAGEYDDVWRNEVSIPYFTNRYTDGLLITRRRYRKDASNFEHIDRNFYQESFGVEDDNWQLDNVYADSEEVNIKAVFSPGFIFRETNKEVDLGYVQFGKLKISGGQYPDVINTPTANHDDSLDTSVYGTSNFDGIIKADVVPDEDLKIKPITEIEKVGEGTDNMPINPSARLRCINKCFDYATAPNNTIMHTQKDYCISYYSGLENGADGWTEHEMSNRNMATPKYLAVQADFPDEVGTYPNTKKVPRHSYVALYKEDPNNITMDYYGYPENVEYEYSNDIITLDNLSVINLKQGDVIPGKVTLKISTWDPSSEKWWDGDDWTEIGINASASMAWENASAYRRYSFGSMVTMFGLFEENVYRRYRGESTEYWPEVKSRMPDYNKDWFWSVVPRSTYFKYIPYPSQKLMTSYVSGIESYLYNKGNSVTMSPRKVLGYSTIEEKELDIIHYPQRIRQSMEKEQGAMFDSMRLFSSSGYKDLDSIDGEIIRLAEYLGYIIAVQRFSIVQLFTNRNAQNLTTSSGMEVNIKEGNFFYDSTKKIMDIGIENYNHLTAGKDAIYGYSNRYNVFFSLGAKYVNKSLMIDGLDLTQKLLINEFLTEYVHVENIDNTFSQKKGLKLYHDSYHKKLYLINYDKKLTSVYSEVYGGIYTVLDFHDKAFFSVNRQLYGVDWDKVLRKQESGTTVLILNDKEKEFVVQFFVNGVSKQENLSGMYKYFKMLKVEMDKVPVDVVEFETETAKAVFFPFEDGYFWARPKYENGGWEFPIPKGENGEGKIINLAGKWMKVTVRIRTNSAFTISNANTTLNLLEHE